MIVGFYGYGQAMNLRKVIITLGAAGAAVLASALPAWAITGPFSWVSTSTASWCPSWHGQSGCNTAQTPTGYTSSFDPAQVAINGSNFVTLALSADKTKSGAFNTNNDTGPLETYGFPVTITEKWFLPCSSPAGTPKIDNWPSFWLALSGSGGALPGDGEIDVMEGAKGSLTATYHYVSGGVLTSKSVTLTGPTGFPCGTNGTGGVYTYSVHMHTLNNQPQIDISVNSVIKLTVAQTCSAPCISIGVPVLTNSRYLINGYGDGSQSSPSVGGVNASVQLYQVANS